jgi:single-stranded-DNA-specific exonuclease
MKRTFYLRRFQEDWHKGVIGIVASRLIIINTCFLPKWRQICISAVCKGFDVYNALEACSEHLEQFGGHMYAAG